LLNYIGGDNAVIACLALEALSRRAKELPEVRKELLKRVNDAIAPWSRYFSLRALNNISPAPAPLIGELLLHLDPEVWVDSYEKFTTGFLRDLVKKRTKAGEAPTFSALLEEASSEQIAAAQSILKKLDSSGLGSLKKELESGAIRKVDEAFLSSIGKVWREIDIDVSDIARTDRTSSIENIIYSLLTAEKRRSVVLAGDSGTGKTTIAKLVAARLMQEGWTIFTAGHNELIAGQMYFGQFEERLRRLIQELRSGHKVLWMIPDFHQIANAGKHDHTPVGALDVLLPHIQTGEFLILGETMPSPLERLIESKPAVGSSLTVMRLEPATEVETLAIASEWAQKQKERGGAELTGETLAEALKLTLQFPGTSVAPGNLMHLLVRTSERVFRDRPGEMIAGDDLLGTLSQTTGLPASILDERATLDLDALRRRFAARVLGQPEAVECLVERVAMIKAGVTDPTRPLGVFLFAGPTGTGKTEIAKTLAEFLFGSAGRMIRVDMSELQTADSVSRLVGERLSSGGSLVEEIRKQPFSIVLLDEFEKAHPAVWDLFLQLFDDGRLTDRRGVTADFRHALIIMTSNIGSAIQTSAKMGFSNRADSHESAVRTALQKEFRIEFLNRIDRIVVFRPLNREVMRDILRKELQDAFARRGLRNRAWAVEWEEESLEFLLEKGFTADLGARPLKRAIEQHLLSPLAVTIVNRQFPEGDQFLFVRTDGTQLRVDFVDPDAGTTVAPEDECARGDLDLRSIALDPRGDTAELRYLDPVFVRLRAEVESERWRHAKSVALSMTSLSEFWTSNDRFAILSQAENRDRVEAGLQTAQSLIDRLTRGQHPPAGLVGQLAQQLLLLEAAVEAIGSELPWEAFLLIEASGGGGGFGRVLAEMYRGWAAKRRMRVEPLHEQKGEEPYQLLLSVSGFAAFSLLALEDGFHLLEMPEERGGFQRVQARVRVAPQPADGASNGAKALRDQAFELFARTRDGGAAPPIVRRYRQEPSPLVRDAIRGWRTGRIDLVLAGNFDLIT